mgnify:FL=1
MAEGYPNQTPPSGAPTETRSGGINANELVDVIDNHLNIKFFPQEQRDREGNTAKKGNRVFAEDVGTPIWEYLDTIYWRRIVEWVEYRDAPIRATAIRALSLPEQIPGPPGPPGPTGQAGQAGQDGAPGHTDTITISHSDTVPHTDTITHDDVTTPHTDTPHNDITPHVDTPHSDTYTQTHSDIVHDDTYLIPHTDTGMGGGGGGGGGHSDAYGQDNNTFI